LVETARVKKTGADGVLGGNGDWGSSAALKKPGGGGGTSTDQKEPLHLEKRVKKKKGKNKPTGEGKEMREKNGR